MLMFMVAYKTVAYETHLSPKTQNQAGRQHR